MLAQLARASAWHAEGQEFESPTLHQFCMEYFIIDRMYAGSFLENGNIGHEITNLFCADNGNCYVYVNKAGDVKPEAMDTTRAVLYTRKTDSIHKQEVLGIAIIEKGVHDFDYDEIKYGGVSLRDIFGKNVFNGKFDGYVNLNFKAKKVLLPKKKFYIVDDVYKGDMKDAFLLSDVRFPSQSLRRYIDSSTKSFDVIEKMIKDPSVWDAKRQPEQIDFDSGSLYEDDNYNYLDIIGQQDDENVFSNLIAHFLEKDEAMFVDFCKDVLGFKPIFSSRYKIEREKCTDKQSRMDIFIEDDKNIVVIENKIKSDINGVNERHDFAGDLIQSQLGEYYRYVESMKKEKNARYYVLLPNHHNIDIAKYEHSKDYTKILYSDIYDFFKNHATNNKKELGYYNDFVKALHRHKEPYFDDQYAEMKRRFIRRLEECRK